MSKKSSPRDELHFRRLLARNLALPLGLGFVSSAFFVAVIYYLLSVYQWGDRVERGIAQGHEALRLVIDMETGMRGFLLTNDERFLEPFREAGKRYRDNMTSLRDRKSTRLNSSHVKISYAVFCLKKKTTTTHSITHSLL